MSEKRNFGVLLVFAVLDSVAKMFLQPFYARTTEEAMRRFRATVNDPRSEGIAQFPEDYHLYQIGTFDQETGTVAGEQPFSLGNAATFKEFPSTEVTDA